MQSPTPAELAALTQASNSLWLATLSLMTAFMQQRAPAHRLLLARRIARNFGTLRQQQECFDDKTIAKFRQLEERWQLKAQRLDAAEDDAPTGVLGRLQRLFAR